jgi:quercetin dioxygenase-like cupin family protein
MIALHPLSLSRAAIAASGTRAATAMLLDTPDARLVVFRIKPGQAVAVHRNSSTVLITVLAGHGAISDGIVEHDCHPGDTLCFAPNEPHGMRAIDEELHLLATITPRPGSCRTAPPEQIAVAAGAG